MVSYSMSVEQTADWILKLGLARSWVESKKYACSFKWNEVSGEMLSSLTNGVLESDLLIKNEAHRFEILSCIKANKLYPERQSSSPKARKVLYNDVRLENIPILQPGIHYISKQADQENKTFDMTRSAYGEIIDTTEHESSRNDQSNMIESTISNITSSASVDETASWVMALGKSKSWDEATTYADSFRYNEISGSMLMHLDDMLLESDLDIQNEEHRFEILSSISKSLDVPSGVDSKSRIPGLITPGFVGLTYLWETHSVQLQGLMRHDNESLIPQSICEDSDQILYKFVSESCVAKSTKSTISDNCSKQTMLQPHMRPRKKPGAQLEIKMQNIPTVKNPLKKYRCLIACRIVKGKPSGSAWLKKNETVLVDETKKRRVRLVKKSANGNYEPYGWLHINQTNGTPALEELNDD